VIKASGKQNIAFRGKRVRDEARY